MSNSADSPHGMAYNGDEEELKVKIIKSNK